jgi:hypothetical protein
VQAATKKQHLNNAEEKTLLVTICLHAERGFPFKADILCQYALEIACIQNPDLQDIICGWIGFPLGTKM